LVTLKALDTRGKTAWGWIRNRSRSIPYSGLVSRLPHRRYRQFDLG